MTTTDQRTQLVMSTATLDALSLRAAIVPLGTGGSHVLRAIARREEASFGRWRVPCDAAALAFIRDQAPEIARLWPAVFGEVVPSRTALLAQFGHEAIGQTVAGVEIADTVLRIVFESGATVLVQTDRFHWKP